MATVGFDFGTSVCVVAAAQKGGIDVLMNETSSRQTPAVVGFGDKQRFVGEAGSVQQLTNMKNTIGQIKRLLGRKWDADLQAELPMLGNPPVVPLPDDKIGLEVMYKGEKVVVLPEQLAAMMLVQLRGLAEKGTGAKVSEVVVSVPGYWTDLQRRAMLDACQIAGLNCMRIVNDMTACALSYGIYKTNIPDNEPLKVLFVDVGFANTNVAAVEFHKDKFKILSQSFNRNMGGRNIDWVLSNFIADAFQAKHKTDPRTNPRAWKRILATAEKAKKTLNMNPTAAINIECLIGEIDFSMLMKREEFMELIEKSDVIPGILQPIKEVLEESGIAADKFNAIEILGGSSRAQVVQNALKTFFNRELSQTTNAEENIAITFEAKTTNDVINKAVERYLSLYAIPAGATGSLKSCSLSMTETTVPEIINADETYSLDVGTDGSCSISATNTWGVLRAMETFTQLLTRDSVANAVVLNSSPISVKDSSRYGHRGLLIDTSRHYLSVNEIMRMIDTLPMNKFNVLHMHAVDAESFPLNTPSEPTMVNGAYSPSMTYTMDDLSTLRQYGYDRGVEIVMEIDVPGHAAAWYDGKPQIMADCMKKYTNINNYALNPTLDETYTTLDGIVKDVSKAMKATRIHLGGDEVVYGCWSNDASITSFMSANGITSYDDLLNYFVQKADKIAQKHNLKVTHWEEVFSAGCNVSATNAVFQVWTDSSMMSEITKAKYNVISSPSNYWYLDHSANTWQVMYTYDPAVNLTSSEKSYVIGGEVTMWGEYIDDLNIESMVYPRASAVAERLWSPSSVVDTTDALNRLLVQRCRMVSRGFRAAPVQPDGYCSQVYV